MWSLTGENNAMEMRRVFVDTLMEMMENNPKIVAMDADLGTASSFVRIRERFPEQFMEMGIAEANMIGTAAGMSMRGFVPFVHSFSPFVSRRVGDQLFLEGAYARNTLNIYASDPGVCAAANGGTHTTFEDMAFIRAIPTVQIFDPADGVQLKWLLHTLVGLKGVHYIRANRKEMPQIYAEGSTFELGHGNVLRKGDDVLIIAAGELVRPALDAAEMLARQNVSAEVIDMFNIKPLDKELVLTATRGKQRVVTAENHSIIGGLGSAVAEVLAGAGQMPPLYRVGVEDRFSQVGSIDYLKQEYGLTAEHITRCALGQCAD
ncbi:MAG: transketolase C-terminal domain-containing protein [Eubacteriales bacterium]|nr:transketolase C-terminal domain-containing protein [Eubacteriales bacterium]